MARSIEIDLDADIYRKPTKKEIRSAKDYILRREEAARALEDAIDGILSDAAERVVEICYRYGADPRTFTISYGYNEQMMEEVAEVMDEAEADILALIYDRATIPAKGKPHLDAVIAWMATLGRGSRNLGATLEGYLYKTLRDWEAAIAAMRFMGVTVADAVTRIKTYLHNIYSMPEVLTAIRRRTLFAAPMIRLGGVQTGAVGVSNNGSTNVTGMARTTLQMAWMKSQGEEFREAGAAGYYQLRGSLYDCPVCDEETGFHEGLGDIDRKPYPHPHCQCYRVPIYPNEQQ